MFLAIFGHSVDEGLAMNDLEHRVDGGLGGKEGGERGSQLTEGDGAHDDREEGGQHGSAGETVAVSRTVRVEAIGDELAGVPEAQGIGAEETEKEKTLRKAHLHRQISITSTISTMNKELTLKPFWMPISIA